VAAVGIELGASHLLSRISYYLSHFASENENVPYFNGNRTFIVFLLFIYSYVHTLGHFSPLPLTPSLSSPCPSLLGKTYSSLFSNFVEE
jgi:hypothetical protein